MNNQPIGIYDSGVGGLSVLREIKKLLPKESFIYVADQKYVPYGGKTTKELHKLSSAIISFLISKEVKAIVIACNTSTVHSISYLRKKFNLPIIGTVPVMKTIANITKTKKTAVFSTPATAKSPYLTKLINKFAKGITVYKIGGTGLEELVEEGNIRSVKIKKILEKFLLPLKAKQVDAIALGCTHYPFLRNQVEELVGDTMQIVDSGGAVSRRTRVILINNKILANKKGKDYYYTTGDRAKFAKALNNLLGKKKRSVDHLILKVNL
jgi:glutamate racemase